jgi:AcrR family transcriptional regulator
MNSTRTYVKVARATAEERTRIALLNVAEATFFEGRWEATSLHSMATEAGVTKQTLLRHFGSKDRLLEQAFQRAFERVEAQRMQSPVNDISGAVDNLLDHYDAVGDASLKIASMDGGGLVADIGRRARQLHYEWIDHAFGTWLAAPSEHERQRLRAILITLCDVRAWHILTRELRLSRAEARRSLLLSIGRLLQNGHGDSLISPEPSNLG